MCSYGYQPYDHLFVLWIITFIIRMDIALPFAVTMALVSIHTLEGLTTVFFITSYFIILRFNKF